MYTINLEITKITKITKVMVNKLQGNKIEFQNTWVIKRRQKSRKWEQKTNGTNWKQMARSQIQNNYINNHIKCKWTKHPNKRQRLSH